MTIPQAKYCYKNHIPVVAYNALTKQNELCDIIEMRKTYESPDKICYYYLIRVKFNCGNIYIDVSNLIDITVTVNILKANNITIKNEDGSYRSIDDIGNNLLLLYLREPSKFYIKTTEENKMDKIIFGPLEPVESDSLWTISSKNNKYDIKDINIIVPNKVVEVTFGDGTKEKAVCREPDEFSLEQAISICLCKYLIGGSSAYNKAVKNGVKVYENKLKKQLADKEEQERIKRKKAKRAAYKACKAAEKAKAEMERQIEIQKEAYVRAMKEISETNVDTIGLIEC